jgi:hypothetical protein
MRSTEHWIDIISNNDLLLRLEVHDELPYLHCEVFNWSPSKYKEYMEWWVEAMDMLKANDIDYMFCWCLDSKITRFAQMFGFKLMFTDEADQSLLFLKF